MIPDSPPMAQLGLRSRERWLVGLFRRRTQPFGHLPVGGTTIVPFVRTRNLLQPVEEVDAAKVVKVVPRERDRFAGDAVHELIGLGALIQGVVEGRPIQGTVQVGEGFGAVADQVADLAAALQRQGEALEFLGAVDRVEHPGPADLLRAAPRFEVTVDGDQVGQVGFLRMRDVLDPDPDQEIGQPLEVLVHRPNLMEEPGSFLNESSTSILAESLADREIPDGHELPRDRT